METRRQRMRLEPQGPSRGRRINPNSLPPCGFVATVMDFPMMTSTQWHGELIADLASKCWMLRVSQMMGI